MRLFRRKTPTDDAARCPECRERVPNDADECAMCGHDLHNSSSSTDRSAAGS
jgi:rRNA maturation endonuclease Nob1